MYNIYIFMLQIKLNYSVYYIQNISHRTISALNILNSGFDLNFKLNIY